MIITWLNDMVAQARGTSSSSSASSTTLPPGEAIGRAVRNLGLALKGIQTEDRPEHWIQLAETVMFLEAVRKGEAVAHPADVMAATRGILTSNLARERRQRRARGMILDLQDLRNHLAGGSSEELNAVHAALLRALDEVEELMFPAAGETLPPAPLDTAQSPPAQGEWWLHDRHHGLGNAPGEVPRSPTVAVASEDGESMTSHRRRRQRAALLDD
ncbi:unnamed protein product [Symbiodinium necroappetens]|uniref:Uncharacterized protein n=1 Tax=Symbiodinium necroappetens TaxID=1628268 RepID=A0A813C8U4_9DINO|nr:unnamed protein product [Symbiodinium necroappetens]